MSDNPTAQFRIHLRVTGRVQNVGFRAFVQQAASLLHLTGWVRNVGHDQVEAEAEGSRQALEVFIHQVGEGPRGSRVDDLQVEWVNPVGGSDSFIFRSST